MAPAPVCDVWPVIQEPATGDTRNRCGLCCITHPCAIERLVFGIEKGECPALQWDAGGSICGIISTPKNYMRMRVAIKGANRVAAAAKFLLGAGCNFGDFLQRRASNENASSVRHQARASRKRTGRQSGQVSNYLQILLNSPRKITTIETPTRTAPCGDHCAEAVRRTVSAGATGEAAAGQGETQASPRVPTCRRLRLRRE
jgi:hypothetical protein